MVEKSRISMQKEQVKKLIKGDKRGSAIFIVLGVFFVLFSWFGADLLSKYFNVAYNETYLHGLSQFGFLLTIVGIAYRRIVFIFNILLNIIEDLETTV